MKSIIFTQKIDTAIFIISMSAMMIACLFSGCAGVGGSISYPVNGKKITLSIDDKEVKEVNGSK